MDDMAVAAGKQIVRRREPLSRERILDAAMLIIEAEGLDSLSMRRIGRELHVRDMALYHHFERKDEILSGLVTRMFDAFDAVKPQGVEWRAYMIEVMSAFRAVGQQYPQTFLLYSRRPWREGGRSGDSVHLRAAGFDEQHAEYVLRNLVDYVTGFVVRHDVPRVMNEKLDDEGFDADAAFRFGLTAILDGCEAWLDRNRRAD
jgi:AcrR family transcriptional regulator